MNRLKFRAWDGEKMHYPDVVTIGVCGWNGEISASFQPASLGGGYCTTAYVMQFTGLTDRNGKEIYEGDIDTNWGGSIQWCNKCNGFQLFSPAYGCMACEGDVHWYELHDGNFEIHGNIHANPDLLEK